MLLLPFLVVLSGTDVSSSVTERDARHQCNQLRAVEVTPRAVSSATQSAVGVWVQSTVPLLDYKATIPKGWTARTASSKMRLAEFVAGPAEAGAEVVIYFFGLGQGGPVDANLARWKSQFSNPDGGAVTEKVTTDKSGLFPLTVAEYAGTYARGIGMGSAPEQARANHLLVAVVAETPTGTIFFQLFGPAAAVVAQRAAYLSFVRSMK